MTIIKKFAVNALITLNCYFPVLLFYFNLSGCIASLGMENRTIVDAQISASSQYDRNSGPQSARLNGRGGWRPSINNRDQWLQVDLEKYTTVSRIATQGRSSRRYGPSVTSYRLQYSDDGVNYHSYKARGQDSVKVRPVGQHYLRKVPSFFRKSTFEHKTSKFGHKMPNR